MDRDEVGREGPMARSEEGAMEGRDVSTWAASIHLVVAYTTRRRDSRFTLPLGREHGDKCHGHIHGIGSLPHC